MSVVQIARTAGKVKPVVSTMSEYFDGLGRRWIQAFKNTADGIRTIVLEGKRDIEKVQGVATTLSGGEAIRNGAR